MTFLVQSLGMEEKRQDSDPLNAAKWGSAPDGPTEEAGPEPIPWVRLGDGRFFVPQRFQQVVTDPEVPDVVCELTVEVPQRGRPQLIGIHCVSAGPITGKTLRELRVGYLLKQAVALRSIKSVIQSDGSVKLYRAFGPSELTLEEGEADFSEVYKQVSQATRRRSRRLPDEHLERVSEIYRRALTDGKPPTVAVAEEMPGSRSSAGRWVWQARQAGLLGPATPRQPGELEKEGDN